MMTIILDMTLHNVLWFILRAEAWSRLTVVSIYSSNHFKLASG